MPPRLAVVLSLAFATACGPLVRADLDDLVICKTLKDQAFPAAPVEQTAVLSLPLEYDLREALFEREGLDSELSLESITIAASAGSRDVTFIDGAALTVDAGDRPVELGRTERAPGEDNTTKLELRPNEQVDLLAYVRQDRLRLDGELSGTLPTEAWAVDVTACFRAKARFEPFAAEE